MFVWLAVLSACHGQVATTPPAAPPEPIVQKTSELTERLRIGLRFDKAQPIAELDGTVTLVQSESDHGGPGLREGLDTGIIELKRGEDVQRIPFETNVVFEAWGYRMAVFGGGGNLELGVFPHGAPLEP